MFLIYQIQGALKVIRFPSIEHCRELCNACIAEGHEADRSAMMLMAELYANLSSTNLELEHPNLEDVGSFRRASEFP